jgi:predicted RNA-binding Zn-ribbon protein involved in translation (DUF1610 family)
VRSGSGKKASDNDKEETKETTCGLFKCPNCGELGHRKNSPKCHLNGTQKR